MIPWADKDCIYRSQKDLVYIMLLIDNWYINMLSFVPRAYIAELEELTS